MLFIFLRLAVYLKKFGQISISLTVQPVRYADCISTADRFDQSCKNGLRGGARSDNAIAMCTSRSCSPINNRMPITSIPLNNPSLTLSASQENDQTAVPAVAAP